MTQISGKIYQMDNNKTGAERELRFPKTVMEAVYGLNSYLQTQFGNLASIYMPIEGITETKQNQEFVYRKSPATIKAKSVTIDRIKGKTLAWNQSVLNGDFRDGSNNFGVNGCNITISDGVAHLVIDTSYGDRPQPRFMTGVNAINGHKYYISCEIKANIAEGNLRFAYIYGSYYSGDYKTVSQEWKRYSIIGNNSSNDDSLDRVTLYIPEFARQFTSGDNFDLRNCVCFDLTLMFGSGNEPTTVEEFESMFPGYHPYNSGELKSNDAEALEMTGFNVWDEEWEVGGLDGNGNLVEYTDRFRSKNFIPVIAGQTYYGKFPYTQIVHYYDANHGSVGEDLWADATTKTIPVNVAYIKFYGYFHDVQPTYNHDICINISNSSKNGTYEPYKKTVLPLNLGSFKVKSHNIWDEEWESGYWDMNDGSAKDSSYWKRSKNKIKVSPNTTYHNTINTETFVVIYYDINDNYIGYSDNGGNTNFTTPFNTAYIRFYVNATTEYTCINESSSFNGQYEPHGEITINGLNGAHGRGDEIVGSKFIQRMYRVVFDGTETYWSYGANVFLTGTAGGKLPAAIMFPTQTGGMRGNGISRFGLNAQFGGGVPQTGTWDVIDSFEDWGIAFNDSLSGQTTVEGWKAYLAANPLEVYYELATPIEYELVEPMVLTTKAGTTEARISPNADGISAPFCADMTYDANANNDSANAQYAMYAGQLLNTHKLWGQDFNGTADVSGDMTGVGNISFSGSGKTIASLLHFDTTNGRIGVGAAPGAYKLDVAGAFRATGNSVIGGTLSVTGATTLTGALTVNNTASVTGNTSVGGTLTVNGAAYLESTLRIGGSSGATISYDSANSGLFVNKGLYSNSYITAGGVNASSDRRLKDDITPVTDGISVIMKLKPSEWVWNENHYMNGKKGAGMVAQDVEPILPFAVFHDTKFLTMNYNVFHAYQIRAIQQLVREVKILKEDIKQLKS